MSHAISLLTEEVRTAMTLAGCPDVRAARQRELVQLPGESPPRPIVTGGQEEMTTGQSEAEARDGGGEKSSIVVASSKL